MMQPNEKQLSFIEHLTELRNRLLRMILAILILVVVLLPFSKPLYALLAEPLLRYAEFIATNPVATVFIPLKLVILVAFLIAIPYVLYETWAFIAPGLYQKEKHIVFPLLASSVFLFYLGIAFAYFVVFPLIFGFFTKMTPEGVTLMPDIAEYLNLVITLFIAFGVAFEVPIATLILVMTGITTPDKLAEIRPYVIVSAFIIGMLITPPDILSQILMAIPIWLLYELGIILARVIVKRPPEEEEEHS